MENVTVVIEQIVATVNSFLWDFALLFLLCGTGIFYTFSLKFIQVRKFKEGWKMLFGNFSLHGKNEGKGLSSFQALTTAIALVQKSALTISLTPWKLNVILLVWLRSQM